MRRVTLALCLLLLTGCSAKPTWHKPLTAAPAGDLVAQDGLLCFVAQDGACYGIDPKDASQKWKFSASKLSARYRPVFAGPVLCVAGEAGVIYALDPKTGKKKWSFPLPQAVGPAAVGDDYVAVQGNNTLVLLDSASGKTVKRITLGGFPPTHVAPLGYAGSVYLVRFGAEPDPEDRFAERKAFLHCYLCPSLEETWEMETGDGLALAADDTTLAYLKDTRGMTEAQVYDRKSGKLQWSGYQPPTKAKARGTWPSLADGHLFLCMSTGLDAFLVSLKTQSSQAEESWRVKLPINPNGAVACSGTLVSHGLAIVGEDSRVVAVSTDTGKQRWSIDELEGLVTSTPVVVGDNLYFATDKKQLYAFKL